MAEGIVGLLISKLGAVLATDAARLLGGSQLLKKASALRGLFSEIHDVKDELEGMQAFLQGAELFRDTDKTTGIFVKKIRDLAFEIEDVVDEFTYKLEDNHGGFAGRVKKRIKHVKTWHRLTQKLQEIRRRVEAADRRDVRYQMRGIQMRGGCSATYSKSVGQTSYFAREEDLVGIGENKEQLIQWLTGDMGPGSRITTVWGMGGVGKTTLVNHVYNTVKVEFDAAAWLAVSKGYDVGDLMKKMARDFRLGSDIVNMEIRSLTESMNRHLQGKKCIVVMDDVWGVDVWFKVRHVFPTNCIGRFIITSRIHEVSLLATTNHVIQLKPLHKHHSWELFCKEAFWNSDSKTCPPDLICLAQKFVEKCNGLPIAIACIGRLLSCKQLTYSEWENMYKQLELQLTNNAIFDVNSILKLSLEDLPYDLRNCLMYCTIFPEDYLIRRRNIMRQWITAGFIKEIENKTLEEVAEGYLNELVNRSLLQAVERNENGRLRRCQMHDIIHLLALKKSNEECFCQVYSGSRKVLVAGSRRLSIQSENLEQLDLSGATYLRALHVFKSHINTDLLRRILESSKMLSTLALENVRIKMLPKEVFDLFNLRYLGLQNTDIETLPESLGRLQNLEVLDAFETNIIYLPKHVVKLKKLRYLFAGKFFKDHAVMGAFRGVQMADGLRHLTGLHCLQCVKASSEILHDVGALTELRTLGVSNVKSKYCADLCDAISKLSHLVHLEITASGEMEVLRLQGLHLPMTLSWLGIEGELEKTSMPQVLSSWSHLNKLTRLRLAFCNLDEDSFSSLLVLHGLCWLDISSRAYVGKRLNFYDGSFPKLRTLTIGGAPELNQVDIEKGAMQSLVDLTFIDCPHLSDLPHGVEHLTVLEKLYLLEASEELIERLRQMKKSGECSEDRVRISHIRNVTIGQVQKQIWERIIM
ncbi:disease resistance protein RPM1-like [Oryza brachyantha]|uniref:Disease resistance protein RPM1 n=1 Tax=Oryza brachyantha TaxID=4533 RepID=J3N153_ORYBR|nr:disease resistance protein RPM1-like [Oryza brachyantha]